MRVESARDAAVEGGGDFKSFLWIFFQLLLVIEAFIVNPVWYFSSDIASMAQLFLFFSVVSGTGKKASSRA